MPAQPAPGETVPEAGTPPRKLQRVSSYVVCVRAQDPGHPKAEPPAGTSAHPAPGAEAGEVLLTRWVSPVGPQWSLPGGGIEFGEDVRDAALREVREETGYDVELDRLLTVDTLHLPRVPDANGRDHDHFAIRVVYAGHVVGGELRDEVGGSSDRAAWVPLAEVSGLTRVTLVDIGIAAWRAEDPGRHAVLRPAPHP